jgi:hypothetical protein
MQRKTAMAKTKKTARKPGPAAQATVTPLDKHDPRVRAAAAELIAEIVKKQEAERAAQVEKAAKDRAALEQAEKAKAKKRAPVKEIVKRLGSIAEPLWAIHDIADGAITAGGDDHEAALIAASNLAMICFKRLDDCLVDLGNGRIGNADAWLAGTEP